MSISFVRVPAPGETWGDDRNDPEICPTLPVVLGRGSLLKCGDKTISRRHAYLDWDDDGVMITSVHQSPTYVIVKGNEKELGEGDCQLLGHGDKFGLQKSNFWYQINLPVSCKDKQTNGHEKGSSDELVEKEKISSSANHIDADNQKDDDETPEMAGSADTASTVSTKDRSHSLQENKDSLPEKNSKDMEESSVLPAVTAEDLKMAVSTKKRNLPAWMKDLDISKKKTSPEKEDSKQCPHGGVRKIKVATTLRKPTNAVKNDEEELPVNTKKNTPKRTSPNKKKAAISDNSDDDEGPPSRQSTPKKRQSTPKGNKKVSPSPSPRRTTPTKKKGSPLKNKTKGLHTMSSEESEGEGSEEEVPQTPKKNTPRQQKLNTPRRLSPAKRPSPRGHDLSDEEEEDLENTGGGANTSTPANDNKKDTASPKKKKPRYPCQYGASCYRKNRKHLADFSHVGDSDYFEDNSDDDDPDDERPQCEYGVDCYRKNAEHRKNYRHSRVPQPQRRAKRKARQQKRNDDDDSDDYDYDDPFLNDGSSDDYAPTDSDSDSPMEADKEEEEDTRRMLKEGKKFVKKRR